jgi:hypothetical protein
MQGVSGIHNQSCIQVLELKGGVYTFNMQGSEKNVYCSSKVYYIYRKKM